MADHCWIGIDLGTSGCRAVAIDHDRRFLAQAQTPIPEPVRDGAGGVEQEPELWWRSVIAVLSELSRFLPNHRPAALCVDGTSSTLLLCTADGTPLAPGLMYNDSRSHSESERIAVIAPVTSPARGASSSLAKLLSLKMRLNPPPGTLAMHQSDWVLGRLTGRFGVSDWNNCLKLGYEPRQQRWPDWIARLDLDPVELPRVVAPGTVVGHLRPEVSLATGLPEGSKVVAGTTDSTAAVIATGAKEEGEAVTSLGSSLVVKILAEKPITAPEYGIYSHRYGDLWLIGGASNSGGAVLRNYFTVEEIIRLTPELRPDEPTGLDYYPLSAPGERFPINDPCLRPRLTPRPVDNAMFLQGMLEGIAHIEAAGYRRLAQLGAPAPRSLTTVGGGAGNPGWTRIRERILGVPVVSADPEEAAFGAALLALARGVPN